jgi:hypothetical protein
MNSKITDTALLTREEAAHTLDTYGSLTVTAKKRRHKDGELHVHYCPRWRIVDRNLEALQLLQAQFGGTIFHHSGRHFSWEIGQAMLAGVLEEVLPLMRDKRRHAELILQLIELKTANNDREPQHRLVEELRYLNAQV